MRLVKYKTHWSYMGSPVKREALLSEFLLDIPYFIDALGVIPPLHVLNEILEYGGNNGGMGPGTTWRPFKIKEAEYDELVTALLQLDVQHAKQSHPYVSFNRVIHDPALSETENFNTWITAAAAKYPVSQR